MTTSDKTESFVASSPVFQSVVILGPQYIVGITRLGFVKSGFRILIHINQVITRKRYKYWIDTRRNVTDTQNIPIRYDRNTIFYLSIYIRFHCTLQ